MKSVVIQKAPVIGLLITFPDQKDVFLQGDDIENFWHNMPRYVHKKYIENGGYVRLRKGGHAAWCLSEYRTSAQDIDVDFYERMGLTY